MVVEILIKFINIFLDYAFEVFPYYLFAVFLTSVLRSYTNPFSFLHLFFHNKFGPFFAGLLGGLLPFCSCSMIPFARFISIYTKNYAGVLSFLYVAPILSPVTILLTYGMLGQSYVYFRIVYSLFFALFFSYLSILFFKKHSLDLDTGRTTFFKYTPFFVFLKDFIRELFFLGKYLFLGLLIASLLLTFLSKEHIFSLSQYNFSYLLIAVISLPLYICSGEEVPISRALLELGLTPGQVMVFIFAGTGICVPTIVASLKFLPLRVVIYYVGTVFLQSVLAGLIFDFLKNFLTN